MTTIPLSEAKNKLSQLVKETSETTKAFAITVNGRSQVMLISMEEYESMLETIEILKNNELVEKIAAGAKEIQKGETVDFDDIRRDA